MSQFHPLLVIPMLSTGALTAHRFVTQLGATAGADANAIGVANSSCASGERCPVIAIGTAIVEAGAAVAAGATVKSDSSGRAITWVTSGARLGIALQAATAAGQMIEVLLIDNAT